MHSASKRVAQGAARLQQKTDGRHSWAKDRQHAKHTIQKPLQQSSICQSSIEVITSICTVTST
eukprot:4963332-Pleurochrysis_carterae.AAC.1